MSEAKSAIKTIFTWFLRPLFAAVILGFFCAWINGWTAGNIGNGGVLIAAMAASFVLIFPSYYIIRFLGAKHKILKVIFICLVIFIGIPMVGYFSGTTALFRTNLLKDAVIYNGPMYDPRAVALASGEIITMFDGQINLFVKPGTSAKKVKRLTTSVGGTVRTQMPAFGYYLVEISENFEAAAAKIKENEFVLNAEPNLMIAPAGENAVDLADADKDSEGLIAAFLKSPDPGADVITVEIDIFKGNHGAGVNGVREAAGAKGPVLQIDVGGVKCGESYCASADRVYSALTAVLAGAEMNRQKVVINISLAVIPLTENKDVFSKKNGEGSNAWATTQWESFAGGILNIVEASIWAKKNNVIVSQAAGNGACLLDENNSLLDCVGVDLSDLMLLNHLAENNINIYGVEEKGKPADYSNHGKDVIMKEISAGSRGTSIAAAQGWAES